MIDSIGKSPVFAKVKENAVWAWEKTVEKIQSAAIALKQLAVRVWEAVWDFFSPKLSAVKESFQGCYSRLTGKAQLQPSNKDSESGEGKPATDEVERTGLFRLVGNWFR